MQRHLLLRRQQRMLRAFSARLPLVRRITRSQQVMPGRLGLPVASEVENPVADPWLYVVPAISDLAPGEERPLPAGSPAGQRAGSGALSPGQAALVDPARASIAGLGASFAPEAGQLFAGVAASDRPSPPPERPPALTRAPAGRGEEAVLPPRPVQRWRVQELPAAPEEREGQHVQPDAHRPRSGPERVPASPVQELPAAPEERAPDGEREGQHVQPDAHRPRSGPERVPASGAGDAEILFAPRETDRSPQAWLARLTRQAGQEQAQRRPEPASQRARAFLRPLLGIDPGEVPIYRDAQAAQATGKLGADALSVGARIELAPGAGEGTPEALGLLAHELTHTARRQQPRFLPPVVYAQTRTGEVLAPAPELLNEEALAQRVEQQVRRAARAAETATGSSGTASSPGGPAARGIWGNLPAPWEPLPAWPASASSFTAAGAAPPAASSSSSFSEPFVTWQAPGEGPGGERQGDGQTGVRRAGIERADAGQEDASAQETPEHTPTQEPEQDLDDLARQVYNVLKRRLGVEQRRGA